MYEPRHFLKILSPGKSQLSKPLEEAAIVGQLSTLCEFDDWIYSVWIYSVHDGQSVDLRPPLRSGTHRCGLKSFRLVAARGEQNIGPQRYEFSRQPREAGAVMRTRLGSPRSSENQTSRRALHVAPKVMETRSCCLVIVVGVSRRHCLA